MQRRSRLEYVTPVSALAGVALLIAVVAHAGPARLATQLRALGAVLPVILLVTGTRYVLQAAGWRLAMQPDSRPGWGESIRGVLVGEAMAYVSWAGSIAGEPAKALFVRDRVPVRIGLTAGMVERTLYGVAAAALVLGALAILLVRAGDVVVLATGGGLLAFIGGAGVLIRRLARRSRPTEIPSRIESAARRVGLAKIERMARGMAAAVLEVARDLWHRRRVALVAMMGLVIAQQAICVVEAYVILSSIGATPSAATAIIFEAATKIVNFAGVLVPGRLGIYEGASAMLADVLRIGATYGISLALTRRMRALIWGTVGITLLAHRAARASRHGADSDEMLPASGEGDCRCTCDPGAMSTSIF